MTVGLQDTSMILGLPLEGLPVSGIIQSAGWHDMVELHIEVRPADANEGDASKKTSRVNTVWLRQHFTVCPQGAANVCVSDYVCMHFVWKLCLVHGKCPHIGFWMSGGVLWFFCRCVELGGQQKPEENYVCGWHQACHAVAHGAATCACRATPVGAGVLGNMGEGYRPLPRIAAPRETARQKHTVMPWSQARQNYPAALSSK
jgi:hypothetical protein